MQAFSSFPVSWLDYNAKLNFIPGVLNSTFNTPYVVQSIMLRVNFSTPGALVLEPLSGFNGDRNSTQMSSQGWSTPLMLSVGLNLVRMRSVLDGNYTIYVFRSPPDIVSLTLQANCSFQGAPPSLKVYAFSPVFDPLQHGATFVNDIQFYCTAIQIKAVFSNPSTVYLDQAPSALVAPGGVALMTNTFLAEQSLPWNSTTVFHLVSSLDGVYTLVVNRHPPDIVNIALVAVGSCSVGVNFPLTPAFIPGSYSYTSVVPFCVHSVAISPTYSSPINVIRASLLGLQQQTITTAPAIFNLPPGLSINPLFLVSSLDGNFTIMTNRSAPDLLGMTITGLLPSLGTNHTMLFTPPFSVGTMSYSVHVPFLVTSVFFSTTFKSAGTVTLDRGDPASGVQLTTNVQNGAWSVAPGPNLFRIVSTKDGNYTLILNRVHEITSMLIQGPANATSAGAGGYSIYSVPLVPNLTLSLFSYSVTLPYIMTSVQFKLNYFHNNSVWLDNTPTVLVLGSGFPTAINQWSNSFDVPLINTPMIVHVNSAYDGVYSITVLRNAPLLSAVALTVSSSYVNSYTSTAAIYTPSFSGYQYSYNLTVPLSVYAINISVNAGNILNILSANCAGFNLPLIAQTANPLVVSAGQFALPYGISTCTVSATLDGTYSITVSRTADVSLIALTCYSVTNLLISIPLQPAFVGTIMQYSAVAPYICSSIYVAVSFLTPADVVKVDNGGAPASVTSGQVIGSYPVSIGSITQMRVVASLDGLYSLNVTKANPDVKAMSMRGNTVPFSSPYPDLSAELAFLPGLLDYSVSLPYTYDAVYFRANFSTVGSLLLDRVSGVAGSPSLGLSLVHFVDTPWLNLTVGVNVIRFRSLQDGNYTITLTRRPEEMTAINVQGLADSSTPVTGISTIRALSLDSPLTANRKSYVVYCPYIVTKIQFQPVYPSNDTVYSDNVLVSPRTGGTPVASGAWSPLYSMPRGNNASYTMHLFSTMDGLFTITVIRGYPVMTSLSLSVSVASVPYANLVPISLFQNGAPAIFNNTKFRYTATVNFAALAINASVAWLAPGGGPAVTNANSITIDNEYSDYASAPNGGAGGPVPLHFVSGIPNLIHVNSWLDGNYTIELLILDPNLLGFDGYTANRAGFVFKPPGYPYLTFDPDPTTVITSGARVLTTHLPFEYSNLFLRVYFNNPADVVYVGMWNPTTDALPRTNNMLFSGQTTQSVGPTLAMRAATFNLVYIESLLDGLYILNVTRAEGDLLDIRITGFNTLLFNDSSAIDLRLVPLFEQGQCVGWERRESGLCRWPSVVTSPICSLLCFFLLVFARSQASFRTRSYFPTICSRFPTQLRLKRPVPCTFRTRSSPNTPLQATRRVAGTWRSAPRPCRSRRTSMDRTRCS